MTNLTKRDMLSTFVNGVGNPTCSIALGSLKLRTLDGIMEVLKKVLRVDRDTRMLGTFESQYEHGTRASVYPRHRGKCSKTHITGD
jgi:hypothetical protein